LAYPNQTPGQYAQPLQSTVRAHPGQHAQYHIQSNAAIAQIQQKLTSLHSHLHGNLAEWIVSDHLEI